MVTLRARRRILEIRTARKINFEHNVMMHFTKSVKRHRSVLGDDSNFSRVIYRYHLLTLYHLAPAENCTSNKYYQNVLNHWPFYWYKNYSYNQFWILALFSIPIIRGFKFCFWRLNKKTTYPDIKKTKL